MRLRIAFRLPPMFPLKDSQLIVGFLRGSSQSRDQTLIQFSNFLLVGNSLQVFQSEIWSSFGCTLDLRSILDLARFQKERSAQILFSRIALEVLKSGRIDAHAICGGQIPDDPSEAGSIWEPTMSILWLSFNTSGTSIRNFCRNA